MKISVETQFKGLTCPLVAVFHPVQGGGADAFVGRTDGHRDQVRFQQEGHGGFSVSCCAESGAVHKVPNLSAQVNTGDKTAQLPQQFPVVEFRCPSAKAGVHPEAEGALVVQGPARPDQGAATGISALASSTLKSCSSWIAASLQRPGR